jgi:hypothetical protein
MYIDTLKTMDQLVESGMNDKQAKTLVSIFSELIQSQFGLLATKEDLAKTSNECKAEILEVKMEIKTINSEIKTIKWILGIFAAIVIGSMIQQNLMH